MIIELEKLKKYSLLEKSKKLLSQQNSFYLNFMGGWEMGDGDLGDLIQFSQSPGRLGDGNLGGLVALQ